VAYLQPDVNESQSFYSIYLRIRNDSSSTLTITEIEFDWPPPDGGQGSELPLREIRFADFTDWTASCGYGTTCIWNGWNGTESYETILVCEDCTEGFDGTLSNRQLGTGILKYLKFVFSDELKSGTYTVRITFNNACYLENYQTQYTLP
jgi:hypothetical protein